MYDVHRIFLLFSVTPLIGALRFHRNKWLQKINFALKASKGVIYDKGSSVKPMPEVNCATVITVDVSLTIKWICGVCVDPGQLQIFVAP